MIGVLGEHQEPALCHVSLATAMGEQVQKDARRTPRPTTRRPTDSVVGNPGQRCPGSEIRTPVGQTADDTGPVCRFFPARVSTGVRAGSRGERSARGLARRRGRWRGRRGRDGCRGQRGRGRDGGGGGGGFGLALDPARLEGLVEQLPGAHHLLSGVAHVQQRRPQRLRQLAVIQKATTSLTARCTRAPPGQRVP